MADNLNFTDYDIIQMISSGDPKEEDQAIAILLKHFSPKTKILSEQLGGNGHIDLKIILDDSIFAIVKKIREGAFSLEKGGIASFFYGVAKKRILNAIRDHQKYELHKQNYSIRDSIDVSTEFELTEKNIALMEKAIRKLKPNCRKLILSYWYEGISLKEYATRKGKTAAAVRQQHLRCLDKLREMVQLMMDAQNE